MYCACFLHVLSMHFACTFECTAHASWHVLSMYFACTLRALCIYCTSILHARVTLFAGTLHVFSMDFACTLHVLYMYFASIFYFCGYFFTLHVCCIIFLYFASILQILCMKFACNYFPYTLHVLYMYCACFLHVPSMYLTCTAK